MPGQNVVGEWTARENPRPGHSLVLKRAIKFRSGAKTKTLLKDDRTHARVTRTHQLEPCSTERPTIDGVRTERRTKAASRTSAVKVGTTSGYRLRNHNWLAESLRWERLRSALVWRQFGGFEIKIIVVMSSAENHGSHGYGSACRVGWNAVWVNSKIQKS